MSIYMITMIRIMMIMILNVCMAYDDDDFSEFSEESVNDDYYYFFLLRCLRQRRMPNKYKGEKESINTVCKI